MSSVKWSDSTPKKNWVAAVERLESEKRDWVDEKVLLEASIQQLNEMVTDLQCKLIDAKKGMSEFKDLFLNSLARAMELEVKL
jgi:hypothetical protein